MKKRVTITLACSWIECSDGVVIEVHAAGSDTLLSVFFVPYA